MIVWMILRRNQSPWETSRFSISWWVCWKKLHLASCKTGLNPSSHTPWMLRLMIDYDKGDTSSKSVTTARKKPPSITTVECNSSERLPPGHRPICPKFVVLRSSSLKQHSRSGSQHLKHTMQTLQAHHSRPKTVVSVGLPCRWVSNHSIPLKVSR